MNTITPFNFEGAPVRTVQIDGAPCFVAADVCGVLGLDNISMACSRLDEDEKGISSVDTPSGAQQMLVINESGLYSLILTSRKPNAKQFKRWVTGEVLPTIRKTGSYGTPTAPAIPTNASMFMQSAQVMLEMEGRTAALEKRQITIEARLDEVADASGAILKVCPQNAESITHIRKRINKMFGLSDFIINEAMRQLPYSPKPAGMVLNDNEAAQGSHYAVFWVKDVTAVFKRFVAECQRETTAFVSHPFIGSRFRLAAGKEAS